MTQQRRGPRPNQARREMILRLRESGYTLQQIGTALDPPCSYQAVAEVLRKEKKTSANHLCPAANGA